MKRFGSSIAAAVVGGVVVTAALVAGGAVFASSKDSGASESTGGAASPSEGPREGRPRLLEGAYHSEGSWQLFDGGTRQTTSDVGTIAAVGTDSVTLDRLDGTQITAPVEPGVCIRKDGEPAMLSDLEVGAKAIVTQSDGTSLAIRSGLPPGPRPGERPHQGCGLLLPVVHGDLTVSYVDGTTRTLAFDAGAIASIGEGEISVERRDGETVTLAWDKATVVLDEGMIGTVDDLAEGERAMFFSEDGTVILIRCVQGPPAA